MNIPPFRTPCFEDLSVGETVVLAGEALVKVAKWDGNEREKRERT